MITPESTGTSRTACNIVNTFFMLDGFKPLIRHLDGVPGYSSIAFMAELARIADREIKAMKPSEKCVNLSDLRKMADYGYTENSVPPV